MSNDSSYNISQGYEVLPPTSGKAYPILCDDWNFLKSKVQEISDRSNIYHTIGTLLLGAALSTFIAIITGAISWGNKGEWPLPLIISIACVIVLFLVGIISMHFAKQQRKVKETMATDVLSHMEIIEKRYGG